MLLSFADATGKVGKPGGVTYGYIIYYGGRAIYVSIQGVREVGEVVGAAEGGFVGEGVEDGEGGSKEGGGVAVEGSEVEEEVSDFTTHI